MSMELWHRSCTVPMPMKCAPLLVLAMHLTLVGCAPRDERIEADQSNAIAPLVLGGVVLGGAAVFILLAPVLSQNLKRAVDENHVVVDIDLSRLSIDSEALYRNHLAFGLIPSLTRDLAPLVFRLDDALKKVSSAMAAQYGTDAIGNVSALLHQSLDENFKLAPDEPPIPQDDLEVELKTAVEETARNSIIKSKCNNEKDPDAIIEGKKCSEWQQEISGPTPVEKVADRVHDTMVDLNPEDGKVYAQKAREVADRLELAEKRKTSGPISPAYEDLVRRMGWLIRP